MPLLSICIPTYNRDALLAQTLTDLCAIKWPVKTEIVVSDNASTDDTPRVLAAFPVRSFRQKVNIEAIDNYFSAIRAARGEYAFYLGDDDAVLPEGVMHSIGQMKAHPEWIASLSPLLEVAQGTDKVLQTVNLVEAPFALAKGDFSAALRFFMQRVYHPETPLVRAEAFRRFVTRPRKMWYSYWMVACLLKQGAIGMLNEPTWKHRIRAPSDNPQLQWSYAVDELTATAWVWSTSLSLPKNKTAGVFRRTSVRGSRISFSSDSPTMPRWRCASARCRATTRPPRNSPPASPCGARST